MSHARSCADGCQQFSSEKNKPMFGGCDFNSIFAASTNNLIHYNDERLENNPRKDL